MNEILEESGVLCGWFYYKIIKTPFGDCYIEEVKDFTELNG
jgi:hypothetical protein